MEAGLKSRVELQQMRNCNGNRNSNLRNEFNCAMKHNRHTALNIMKKTCLLFVEGNDFFVFLITFDIKHVLSIKKSFQINLFV